MFKRNLLFLFPLLSVVLLSRDVTKAVFLVNQNGGTSGRYGGTPPCPPPLATALVGSIHFVFNF